MTPRLAIPSVSGRQKARILAQIDRTDGECWRWTGAVSRGQPYVVLGTRRFYVSRVMMLLSTGRQVPANRDVRRNRAVCANTRCVSPAHLVVRGRKRPRRRMPGFANLVADTRAPLAASSRQ